MPKRPHEGAYTGLSYRQLQAKCKEYGLSSSGTAGALAQRLEEHVEAEGREQPLERARVQLEILGAKAVRQESRPQRPSHHG